MEKIAKNQEAEAKVVERVKVEVDLRVILKIKVWREVYLDLGHDLDQGFVQMKKGEMKVKRKAEAFQKVQISCCFKKIQA